MGGMDTAVARMAMNPSHKHDAIAPWHEATFCSSFASFPCWAQPIVLLHHMNRMNFRAIGFLFGLVVCSPAWGQLEVGMNCVVVNQAGNASVSWSEVADPTYVFEAYVLHIFEPSSGLVLDTFSIDDPTDPANPAFVNTMYNANTTELCYFVVTEGPPGLYGPSSDTLCSIHLTAVPSINPGFADIDFNSPHLATTNFDGGSLELTLELEESAGDWNPVVTIPDNGGMMSYAYEVQECTGDLNFRVTQSSTFGCVQTSNQAGSSISDEMDPDPPVISYIDVDGPSQMAVIHWEPSPADDLAGYIIYRCNGSFQMAIDTVFSPYTTFYVDPNANVGAYPEFYNVAAFDSCLVNDAPDPGAASDFCASSLYMDAYRPPCADASALQWNGAFNIGSEITGYQVWSDEESPSGSGNWNPSILLADLGPTAINYSHQGANFGSSYRYHIVASTVLGNSIRSNARTIEFSYPGAPAFTSLRRASVADSIGIDIIVDLDPNSDEIHSYILQRKRAVDDLFFDVEMQEGVGGVTLQYSDWDAKPQEMSYAYRIEVQNYCSDSVGTSNTAHTVHLSGISDTELLRNTIHWTPYIGFPGETAGYRIYRRSQQGAAPQLLTEVPPGVLTWEDDVSALLYSPGDFCYLVEALDEESGPSGGINYSLSNEMCLTQVPVIWVPNAILIGGVNNVFMPVISYADFEHYHMEIHNRWGDVIFVSDQIGFGWDGTHRGTRAPEGSYGYFINVQDGAGRIHETSGIMHLLIGE